MSIPTMTAEAIRRRLAEIGQAERAFAARDLDAELAAVLRNGGDVDAMEAKQLEAERTARRLRAERTALEIELPEVVKREGAAFIKTIETRHREATGEVSIVIDNLMDTWKEFRAAVEAWIRLQDEAHAMTNEAERVARQTNAAMANLGTFQSDRVSSICRDLADGKIFSVLAIASAPMQVGSGVQSRVID